MADKGKDRYSVGTRVKLHTHDDWDSLYGIVDELVGNTIAVSCITMPQYRYFVSLDDASRVLEFI